MLVADADDLAHQALLTDIDHLLHGEIAGIGHRDDRPVDAVYHIVLHEVPPWIGALATSSRRNCSFEKLTAVLPIHLCLANGQPGMLHKPFPLRLEPSVQGVVESQPFVRQLGSESADANRLIGT